MRNADQIISHAKRRRRKDLDNWIPEIEEADIGLLDEDKKLDDNPISKIVINAAIEIHRELGLGLSIPIQMKSHTDLKMFLRMSNRLQ